VLHKNKNKIVKTRASWYKADQVRKIRIVMTMISVALCISIATGAVLAWIQIKHPFDKPSVSSVASLAASASVNSEPLPIYDDSYNLVVVNASTKFKPEVSPSFSVFEGVTVDNKIIPALKNMLQDAKTDGCELKLTSGYVDAKEQDKLFAAGVQALLKNKAFTQVRAENQVQTLIGRGGYNENQTGMAVSFSAPGVAKNTDFTATNQYKWLVKNSVNYGFVLRYADNKTAITGTAFNPYHFRYVGEQNAVNMRAYSMCLEEYAAYVKQQNVN